MIEFDWREGVVPTSYGLGPFHPAIRNGQRIWYWPNRTFETEDKAYEQACLSLADALQPAADYIKGWNVQLA